MSIPFVVPVLPPASVHPLCPPRRLLLRPCGRDLPNALFISRSSAVTLIAFNLSHNCCWPPVVECVSARWIATSIACRRLSAWASHFSFKSSCLCCGLFIKQTFTWIGSNYKWNAIILRWVSKINWRKIRTLTKELVWWCSPVFYAQSISAAGILCVPFANYGHIAVVGILCEHIVYVGVKVHRNAWFTQCLSDERLC